MLVALQNPMAEQNLAMRKCGPFFSAGAKNTTIAAVEPAPNLK